MKNSLNYRVDSCFDGQKLIDYLVKEAKLSRRFCKAATKSKGLVINGFKADLGTRLKTGDFIEITMDQKVKADIVPEPLDLDIVFEDEDVIVLNKPPYMLVHPTKNHETGTLANGLMNHFQKKNESCTVRFVSRLDRDTSGLILVAKNAFAHMKLAKAMESHLIIKVYQGVIYGQLNPLEGVVNEPIGKKNEGDIKRYVIPDGQESITHYRTLEVFKEGALVEFKLLTGRTHQIRVHMNYKNHPLVGDELYYQEGDYKLIPIIKRQALHGTYLTFPHPRTQNEMRFISPLPEDIQRQVEELK